MKFVPGLLLVLTVSLAHAAEDKIKMNYNNEELTKIIETYSKASGQKFIVDSIVRGKISIFQPEAVSLEEAFNQLSTSLALNGYGISKQGDTMVIRAARNIQRDLIEVSVEKPAIKPERMYTWIYTAKYLRVDELNRDLRILTSKDGEMTANTKTNQIIISDWVTNINRVAEILKEMDKPLDAQTAKLVEETKKDRDLKKKEPTKAKEEKAEK